MHRTLIRVNTPLGPMDFYVNMEIQPTTEAAKKYLVAFPSGNTTTVDKGEQAVVTNGRAFPRATKVGLPTKRRTRSEAARTRIEKIRPAGGPCGCLQLKSQLVKDWLGARRPRNQYWLAKRLGVTQGRISDWLRNHPATPMSHRVPLNYADRIARLMHKTRAEITVPFDRTHVRCLRVYKPGHAHGLGVRRSWRKK